MHVLLKLKSWQLFILIVIPALIPDSLSIHTILMYLSLLVGLSWIFVIGVTMHSLIPVSFKPDVKYFRSYFLLIIIALVLFRIAQLNDNNSTNWFSIIGAFIYVAGFICACGFAGKMLESVIEGEIVSNSDSLKAIICLIVFPVGLWYIQPAVQRVLAKYDKPTT